MSDHDALIDLLNGFDEKYGNADDVFLDKNGEPTDKFLQALQREGDVKIRKLQSNYLIPSIPTPPQYDGSDMDDCYSDDDDVFRLHNPSVLRGGSSAKAKAKTKAAPVRRAKKTTNNDPQQSLQEPGLLSKSGRIHRVSLSGPRTVAVAAPMSQKTEEEVKFTNGYDTVNIEVEAEAKVKAIKLRMQGQLQTIRTMEKQLAEAMELLAARNKQLAQAYARLKAIDQRSAQASSIQLQRKLMAEETKQVAVAEENAEKFRVSSPFIDDTHTHYL
jgi:hypothetical protein